MLPVPLVFVVAAVDVDEPVALVPVELPLPCRSSNSVFRSVTSFESVLLSPLLAEVDPVLDVLGVLDVALVSKALLLLVLDDCDWLFRSICQRLEAPLLPIELIDIDFSCTKVCRS